MKPMKNKKSLLWKKEYLSLAKNPWVRFPKQK